MIAALYVQTGGAYYGLDDVDPWGGNHIKSGETRPRVGKAAASRTPEEFKWELVRIAKNSRPTMSWALHVRQSLDDGRATLAGIYMLELVLHLLNREAA